VLFALIEQALPDAVLGALRAAVGGPERAI
jgi:hypothetical protein